MQQTLASSELHFRAMSTNSGQQVVVHHFLLPLGVGVQKGGSLLPDELPLAVLVRVQGRAHPPEETLHPPVLLLVRRFVRGLVQNVPQVSRGNLMPLARPDHVTFQVVLAELLAEFYLVVEQSARAKFDELPFVAARMRL